MGKCHFPMPVQVSLYAAFNLLYFQRDGGNISFKHITDIYYRDREKSVGLLLMPKIKLEHIQLTSFSRMRVDLAAQVLQ